MRKSFLAILIATAALAAVVGAQETPLSPASSEGYVIGETDVLSIRVAGEPDLTGDYTVRLDGMITFPYVGEMRAAGVSLPAFNRELRDGLSVYYKNPQVVVEVDEYNSCVVYVLGEVQKPGVYEFNGRTTLLEIVATAGGYKKTAARASTMVVRSFETEPQVMRIDMEKVIDEGVITLNVPLDKGDVIVVPGTFIANLNEFLADITPSLSAYLRANNVYRASWER
ncbi:MAG: polysaccharide biosynthesis/export family protein [Candidatus Zixiibacteriota bacterium]|jgi:polysaccharide export outer membrane protein